MRARLNAYFAAATSRRPWSDLADQDAAIPATHRWFRRHAHADLWTRLLKAVAAANAPVALTDIASFICAPYRRPCHSSGAYPICIVRLRCPNDRNSAGPNHRALRNPAAVLRRGSAECAPGSASSGEGG